MGLADTKRRVWLARQERAVQKGRFAAYGEGTVFAPPALVQGQQYIHLGRDVFFHPRAWLSVIDAHAGRRHTPRLTIGDGCLFGHDFSIACVGEVTIGDEVQAADRVFIGDTSHGYRDPHVAIRHQAMLDPEPVRIGDGAFLGINSCILAGVTVGERAYVGAGAVVTRNVPANAVVVGNPARVLRHHDGTQWVEG
jgi:acetyltransferase-like isoleucine patch superfamily enzyme